MKHIAEVGSVRQGDPIAYVVSVFQYSFFGLKVFMDAHEPVTLEEGDRYPLGPPSYNESGQDGNAADC